MSVRHANGWQSWGMALAIGALLVATSQAKADTKKPQSSATKPSPRDAGWVKQHEGFVDLAKKGDVDVLFEGDPLAFAEMPAERGGRNGQHDDACRHRHRCSGHDRGAGCGHAKDGPGKDPPRPVTARRRISVSLRKVSRPVRGLPAQSADVSHANGGGIGDRTFVHPRS